MKRAVFLFPLWMVLTCGGKYRYDYKYDSESRGWYKVHIVPAIWSEAKLRCEVEGATLASPTNKNMLESMVARINKLENENSVFTGINAREYNGHFHSIEGFPLNRMIVTWMPYEPNNYKNNDKCAILTKSASLADMNCKEVFPFICFKKAPAEVMLNECGTTDNEYKLNAKTGSCYKFHYKARTWDDAFMTCSGEGGYLAIPDSDEEAEYLKYFFRHNINRTAFTARFRSKTFLGIHNGYHDGQWTTIWGKPLEDGFATWDIGQPDGFQDEHFCAAMSIIGRLHDMWCKSLASFICEKDPKSLL